MKISDNIIEKHGLKKDEFQKISKLLNREPNLLELGVFSAMWNEHCSYKSSKLHLKKLPTKNEYVIQGPGENAGVIDIGFAPTDIKFLQLSQTICLPPVKGYELQ